MRRAGPSGLAAIGPQAQGLGFEPQGEGGPIHLHGLGLALLQGRLGVSVRTKESTSRAVLRY